MILSKAVVVVLACLGAAEDAAHDAASICSDSTCSANAGKGDHLIQKRILADKYDPDEIIDALEGVRKDVEDIEDMIQGSSPTPSSGGGGGKKPKKPRPAPAPTPSSGGGGGKKPKKTPRPAPAPSGGDDDDVPDCPPCGTSDQLTKEEIKRHLEVHNKMRACVKNPTAPPMVWDCALMCQVQKWQDTGSMGHSDCYGSPISAGENMAMWRPMDRSLPYKAEWMWFDEYSYRGGHYTAMVWAQSKKLGCGINVQKGTVFCQYADSAANFGDKRAGAGDFDGNWDACGVTQDDLSCWKNSNSGSCGGSGGGGGGGGGGSPGGGGSGPSPGGSGGGGSGPSPGGSGGGGRGGSGGPGGGRGGSGGGSPFGGFGGGGFWR